jgi:hypothetical protein
MKINKGIRSEKNIHNPLSIINSCLDIGSEFQF